MGKQDNQTSDAGVQVFELTMDNPENQDELNRRLQKPTERDKSEPSMLGRKVQAEPTSDSARKKTGTA